MTFVGHNQLAAGKNILRNTLFENWKVFHSSKMIIYYTGDKPNTGLSHEQYSPLQQSLY